MKTCEHCHDNPATDLHCDTIDGVDVVLYEGCTTCWKRLTDAPIVRAAINEYRFGAKVESDKKHRDQTVKYIQALLDVNQLQKEVRQLEEQP